MNEKRQHVKLVGPTLLIGIGIVFLLNNLGYLDWNLWNIIRLWPLLLIAAGLEIIVGRRSLGGSIIAAVLVLILLTGGIWLIGRAPDDSGSSVQIQATEGDFEDANVSIAANVGQVNIGSLSDSNNLVEGTIHTNKPATIDQDFSITDDSATFRITDNRNSYGPVIIGNNDSTWDLNFHSNTPIDLEVDSGVGQLDLDLSALMLEDINVDFGVADVVISIPLEGNCDLNINGAIGNIEIKVPQDAAVRIETDIAIAAQKLPSNYRQNNNVYTSPSYEDAETSINIEIDLAIGNITVKEYSGN